MKRVKPDENLRELPCAMVAVACARNTSEADTDVSMRDGYVSLPSMNKYARRLLNVRRQVKFKRGERPLLKDLHFPGKAIVCVLGHYIYLEGETYYSFFKNSGDEVVCLWELE